ncbi:hypothetical protein BN128_921 [Cronobacter sakazakii 696]|nr:hypothetical protein BN128_921 [Cronobacter sakazakii 696]
MVFPDFPVGIVRFCRGGPAFVGRDNRFQRREFRQRLGAEFRNDAGFRRLQHIRGDPEIPALPVMFFHRRETVHDAAVVFGERVGDAFRQNAVEILMPVREALFHPRRVPRRLVVAAPGDDGRRIAELLRHLQALPRGVIGKFRRVLIAPLERHVLPDHQPHFISHAVERAARHVAVDANGVGVHIQHQLQIAPVLFLIHLAKPRRADIVTALNENAFTVEHPALVIRLLDNLAQPGTACNALHLALVVVKRRADAVKMRKTVAFRPPELRVFHRQRQRQTLRRGAGRLKTHFLSLRKTLAVKIGWPGAQG